MVNDAQYVAGFDAGATKTVGILTDGQGRVLAQARGGGANLQVQGEAQVEAVFRAILAELSEVGRPQALALGIAGVDRAPDEATIREILSRLGHTKVRIVNDAVIALLAGSPSRTGIVVLSGTGSIAYGIDPHGTAA